MRLVIAAPEAYAASSIWGLALQAIVSDPRQFDEPRTGTILAGTIECA
jgi:hypothetical protein